MKKRRKFIVWLLLCMLCVSTLSVHAEQNEENEIAARVEQANVLELENWIDEEGYLIDEFYEGKSDALLSEMGVDGLVRTWSEEELDAYVTNLDAGIEYYTVTYYLKASMTNPDTGKRLYTGVFYVDGSLAFCIERSVATPAKGAATGERILVTNDDLRKVLYYGYHGPGDMGYGYVETALAAGEANGDGDNSVGRNVLAEIKKYASPPNNFKVWKVETNGGATQDLAFYTIEEIPEKRIQVELIKYRENTTIPLEGAVFEHIDPKGNVEQKTTGADGKIIWEDLQVGTHQIREISPPTGYRQNLNAITFVVDENKEITITSKVDETQGMIRTSITEEGNLSVEVENKVGFQLPETGCADALLLSIGGMFCCLVGLIKKKRRAK